jgi:hypothetical protein
MDGSGIVVGLLTLDIPNRCVLLVGITQRGVPKASLFSVEKGILSANVLRVRHLQ